MSYPKLVYSNTHFTDEETETHNFNNLPNANDTVTVFP